jgi:hypothetical protein
MSGDAVHDHRLPRHDRSPETWLPHPGTPDAPPPPAAPPSEDWPAPSVPAPQPGADRFAAGMPGSRGLPSGWAGLLLETALGRKNVPLAIGLALLGPLGLLYISFVNGVAGLIVVSFVARALAIGLAPMFGGGEDASVRVGIFFCWLITIPWAVIAAKRHNARRGL